MKIAPPGDTGMPGNDKEKTDLLAIYQGAMTEQFVGQGYVFSRAPYSELPEQRLIFLPIYYACQMGLSQGIDTLPQ